MLTRYTKNSLFLFTASNITQDEFKSLGLSLNHFVPGRQWSASLGSIYRKSSIKPPSQISPLPVISPPLPYLFFTNKWLTVLINHDCKPSCGLIQDGLFTIFWKIGFDSDPRLRDLKLLVLELFHFVFLSSLRRTDTTVVSKFSKASRLK